MPRPADFTSPLRTISVVPYQIIANPGDLPERGSSSGGVFHRGQLVWAREWPAVASVQHTAVAFVDGLGYILIDPRLLRPADMVAGREDSAARNAEAEPELAPLQTS